MAAAGYPERAAHAATVITGLPADTRRRRRSSTPAPRCATATSSPRGGRVLCVTALGDSTRPAQQRAYESLRQRRTSTARSTARDIGQRAAQALSALDDIDASAFATTCSACRRASSPRWRREGGDAFRSDAWQRQPGGKLDGRRPLAPDRGRRAARARRLQLLAREGPRAAAVGDAHRGPSSPARRSRRWASRWSSIRATRTCRPCT